MASATEDPPVVSMTTDEAQDDYLAGVLHVKPGTMPGVHTGSGKLVDTLNFILHLIVPHKQITGPQVSTAQFRLNELVEQEFATVINTKVVLHGSIMEGFDGPAYRLRSKGTDIKTLVQQQKNTQKSPDIDFLLVPMDMAVGYKKTDPEVKFHIDDSFDDPGFVGVKIVDHAHPQHDFFKQELNGMYYLMSEEVNKDFDKGLDDGFVAAEVPENKKKELEFTMLNLGLPCKTWPQKASKWLQRECKAGWPKEELKKEIVDDGCYLIPKTRKGAENEKLLWQIVFPASEIKLSQTLSTTHHQVLVLLRLLRQMHFESLKTLTNYMLKTLIYWMTEETGPEWKPEKLVNMLLKALTKLYSFVEMGNFPHFFLPDRNLLEGMSKVVKEKLMETLGKLKTNPVDLLLEFCSENMFQYHPATAALKDLLSPLQDDSEDSPVEAREAKRMCCLAKMAKQFFIEENDTDANALLEEIEKSENGEEPLVLLLPFVTNLDHAVTLCEKLIQHWPDSRNSGQYKGHLAVLLFSQAEAAAEESQKEELMERVKVLFEEAVQSPGIQSVTKVDYVNHMFKTGQVDEGRVIQLLEQVIADEKSNLTPEMIATKVYSPAMKKCLPGVIGGVMEKITETVVLPCLSNSYFLMVQVLLSKDRTEEAKQAVEFFEADVNKMAEESNNIPGHIKFDSSQSPEQYLPPSRDLLLQAALTAEHHRTAANCYVRILERDGHKPDILEELETRVTLMQSGGEDTSEFEDKLKEYHRSEAPKGDEMSAEAMQEIMKQFQQMDAPAQPTEQPTEQRTQQLDLKSLIETAKRGLVLIKEGNAEAADAVKVELLGLLSGKDPEEVLGMVALSCDELSDSIALYEYLIAAYPESQRLYSNQGNLACMFHAKSTQFAEDSQERGDFETKAQEMFKLALEHSEVGSATRMDYGTFLYQKKDFDTLVPLLKQILSEEKPKLGKTTLEGNSYGLNEMQTVEENIKKEIEQRRKELSIASLFHALYLEVQILKSSNDTEKIMEVLRDFQLYAKKLPSQDSYQETTWALLGYAAQEAEQYSLAVQAFRKVLHVAPRNMLAEENLQLNQAMQLSIAGNDQQLGEFDDDDDDIRPDDDDDDEAGSSIKQTATITEIFDDDDEETAVSSSKQTATITEIFDDDDKDEEAASSSSKLTDTVTELNGDEEVASSSSKSKPTLTEIDLD